MSVKGTLKYRKVERTLQVGKDAGKKKYYERPFVRPRSLLARHELSWRGISGKGHCTEHRGRSPHPPQHQGME